MQGDNQLMFTTTTMNLNPEPQPQQQRHEHLKCPRCESNNTKFCYYNNYNLSQPRHFCKNCRRYWTKGGTLRNIPIGGSTRKKNTKRSLDNSNKNTSIETFSSNIPHVVHEQKHEASLIQGYGNDQMGLTPGGQFAKLLMDGLNPNFVGGTNENGLIRNTSNIGEFDSGFLGMGHQSNDQSHVSEGGHNGWPDLSIYTPGSSFH